MFSLSDFISKNNGGVSDIGDRKPNRIETENAEEGEYFRMVDSYEKLKYFLNSRSQSLILYALSKFSVLCEKDSKYLTLLGSIIPILSQSQQTTEYAALSALKRIAYSNPKQIVAECLSGLLTRIKICPASEYVQLLSIIMPYISVDMLKNTFFPCILEMLKLDEMYQHAACNLLIVFPLDSISLTTDSFSLLLTSVILVSMYLDQIVKKCIMFFGENWISNVLVRQLISLSNSKENIRAGSLRAILHSTQQLSDRNVYSFLLSGINWAHTNDSVALEILESSELILKHKKAEFQSKLRDIAMKLTQSSDKNTRIRIIKIMCDCPSIFSGSEAHLKTALKNLSDDSNPEVKSAFLTKISMISSLSSSNVIKDLLLNAFISFFSDSSKQIKLLLCSSNFYSMLGNQRIQYIITSFIRLLSTPPDNWRLVSEWIKTFVTFPDDSVLHSLQTAVTSVNSCVSKYPFALSEHCTTFYIRISNSASSDDQTMDWIITTLVRTFARSKNHALRSLFVKISNAILYQIPHEKFNTSLWPSISMFADDPVAYVRVTLLRFLPKFRNYFKQQGDSIMDSRLIHIFKSFEDDSDDFVQVTRTEIENQMYSKSFGSADDDLSLLGSFPTDQGSLPSLSKTRKKSIVSSASPIQTPQIIQRGRNRTNSLSHKSPLLPKKYPSTNILLPPPKY